MVLGGVSENGNIQDTGKGDKALGVWLKPENDGHILHTATYNIRGNNFNDFKLVNFPSREDYDSSWNFVYMGYSYNQNRAVLYTYFSKSNQVVW